MGQDTYPKNLSWSAGTCCARPLLFSDGISAITIIRWIVLFSKCVVRKRDFFKYKQFLHACFGSRRFFWNRKQRRSRKSVPGTSGPCASPVCGRRQTGRPAGQAANGRAGDRRQEGRGGRRRTRQRAPPCETAVSTGSALSGCHVPVQSTRMPGRELFWRARACALMWSS